jgi:three-Cys-motif partner protein
LARTKKVETITKISPHTVKKFELIEKYVDEWARKILGFNGTKGLPGSKGVIYIDCMCNSGVYEVDGKLVEGTALRVAKKLNEIISNYPGKEAILLFNDLQSERVDLLRTEIENANLENIIVSYNEGDCNAFLKGLNLSAYQQGYNTLLLYDPYNASIDWSAVKPFLNRWGEVIINHMSSDTTRGISQAKKQDVIARYEETYQSDISQLLNTDKAGLDNIVVSIIRNNINKGSSGYYVSLAPFYNRTNGKLYSLIHCSANIEGTKLYKKVTWKTFGDKSSMKNTHGVEEQFVLDFNGDGFLNTVTDEDCYYVKDIAKYIFEKYSTLGRVSLDVMYKDLDVHPIFPSDGYKNEIKAELKDRYYVRATREEIIFSQK